MVKNKIYIELLSQEKFEKLIKKCIEEYGNKVLKLGKDNENLLMTNSQCCKFLQISRVKLWQLVRDGVIPSYRIGNGRRFSKKEILKTLNNNSKKCNHD